MKKIFVSMPMNGRSEEAIKSAFVKTKNVVEAALGEEVEVIDTWLEGDEYSGKPIMCLGESIKRMQGADLFVGFNIPYFVNSQGCEAERDVAYRYGIEVLLLPIQIAIPSDELRTLEEQDRITRVPTAGSVRVNE